MTYPLCGWPVIQFTQTAMVSEESTTQTEPQNDIFKCCRLHFKLAFLSSNEVVHPLCTNWVPCAPVHSEDTILLPNL